MEKEGIHHTTKKDEKNAFARHLNILLLHKNGNNGFIGRRLIYEWVAISEYYTGQIIALFILCEEAKKNLNSLQRNEQNFTNNNQGKNNNHIINLYFIVVN